MNGGRECAIQTDQVRRIRHHELKFLLVLNGHIERGIVIVEGELVAVFSKSPVVLIELRGNLRIPFLRAAIGID